MQRKLMQMEKQKISRLRQVAIRQAGEETRMFFSTKP
jgi:hypothetical protein